LYGGGAGTGIPISELSQYHFIADRPARPDTVAFNVEDEYDQISTAVSATVSASAQNPTPPTRRLTIRAAIAPGTSIALSTLFTYSFAAGDTIVGFDFKETTNNGGYITDPNGNKLTPGDLYGGGAGTGIPISELSQYHIYRRTGRHIRHLAFMSRTNTIKSARRSALTVSATNNQIVSTPGSNISFDDTYDVGVTKDYENWIVSAEKNIEQNWTAPNSIVINLDFFGSSTGIASTSYAEFTFL